MLVSHREFGTSPRKPAVQEFSPSPRIQEQRAYEQRVQASNHLARQAKQLKQRVGYLTQQVRATTLFILCIYFWCFMWSTNWKQFLQFCTIFYSDNINTIVACNSIHLVLCLLQYLTVIGTISLKYFYLLSTNVNSTCSPAFLFNQ